MDQKKESNGAEIQGSVTPALDNKEPARKLKFIMGERVERLQERAQVHLQMREWLQAGEDFSALIAADEGDEDTYLGLAQALDGLNRYESLYETALHMLENDLSSAQGLAFKARALQKLERISEATIANDQALLLDTNLPLAWINRSGLQLLQQKFPEALRSAQRATELAPDDERAWANKGVALLNFNHALEALTMFERALQIDSHHLFSLQMRGEILCRLGRMREAIPMIQRAMLIDEHNVAILRLGVQVFRGLEEHAAMHVLAQELTTLTPDSLFAWEHYVRGLRGAGRYEEALSPLDHLLEMDAANVRFWTMKADTLYRLERYREAARVAERAVRLYSDYPPARRIREKSVRMMYQRKDKKKS